MANIKQALDTNAFINGAVVGGGLFGVVTAIKKIMDNRRMRKQLADLESLAQKELAKEDISLSGDFFKDKYQPYLKEAGDLTWMPSAALFASGLGAGYAGTNIIKELVSRKRAAETPSFAVEYKNKRKKEFERAARLLRAVTDAPTWKDVARAEKEADMEKEAYLYDSSRTWPEWLAGWLGRENFNAVGDAGRAAKDTFTQYIFPALEAAAIGGAGYLGYKGLNKLLYSIRKYKNKKRDDDYAIRAWLAQRKDLGESGKTLNTYIDTDDSAERKELNKLLSAYESHYKS